MLKGQSSQLIILKGHRDFSSHFLSHYTSMDVKSPYSEGGCLAKVNPFKRRRVDDSSYTDADLAAELNALSVKERQAMEEDIHGVSSAIPETPEFIESKVKELHEAIRIAPPKQREAWEYAVYLRPALALDRDLALLFLRSRRFQASLAAKTLLIFFQNKRDLFGDDLLIHRITWDDVSFQFMMVHFVSYSEK